MNTASIKQAAVRLGGLGALIGVTVLLTILFSILGNITCAVVAGVIFGSGRRWQWLALPCSLVFPGVILLLSHYSKVELPPGKVSLVALLSAGAFWGVMGLARILHFVERKPEAAPTASGPPGNSAIGRTEAANQFNLAVLSGSWTCDEPAGNGLIQSRTLRIEQGKFQLVERRHRGRDRIVAHGEVSAGISNPREIIFAVEPAPLPEAQSPDR